MVGATPTMLGTTPHDARYHPYHGFPGQAPVPLPYCHTAGSQRVAEHTLIPGGLFVFEDDHVLDLTCGRGPGTEGAQGHWTQGTRGRQGVKGRPIF